MNKDVDYTILSERVHTQDKEIEELNNKITKLENRNKRLWFRVIIERVVLGAFGIALAVAALGGVGYMIYKSVTASDIPTHCEVRAVDRCTYILNGVIPWGPDVSFGRFPSVEMALEAAEQINCEVKWSSSE